VRDALKAGKTTVLVPTGGVERDGAYLATGAATMVLRSLSETRYFNKMFVLYEATFVSDESGKVSRLTSEGPWGRQEFMRSK
jgi:hypothetical protein